MRLVAWLPAVFLLALAFGTSIDLLAEAYGEGPPYYGRTTNMDKWSDPWPVVLMMSAIALGAVALTRWALGRTAVLRGYAD